MDKVASPDIAAYWCYLIVLVIGVVVARSSVNRLLADQPGRWAFFNTWLLLGAYSVVPVILFWFLDYTGALKDTALFGALVVGAGYQQVFAGGVQGIIMPGQTSRLWKPFESWVQDLAARIVTSSKRSRDKFEESVRSYIASDPQRIIRLQALAVEYSQDSKRLTREVAALRDSIAIMGNDGSGAASNLKRQLIRLLIDDLRAAVPESYGDRVTL
jgi:hypothetical protein